MRALYKFVCFFLPALILFTTSNAEDILPKYQTQAEIEAYQMQKYGQLRGQLSSDRMTDSCDGICGEQAPSGCWCDNDCVQHGDCCFDFLDVCGNQPDVLEMPEDMWVPGEFEEVQSVLLRWPTSSSGAYRRLYTALADAIQQEAEVWIVYSGDTTNVHNMMDMEGKTLYNHKFLNVPSNSIWARDYGPFGFYHGEEDELAFIDMQYYPSRPLDNDIPQAVADMMGIDNYVMNLYQEGGNLMVDGFGFGYYSTGAYDRNPIWTEEIVDDYKKSTFDFHSVAAPLRLSCDGGTGHIDMYAKLIDERSILVTEYPEEVTAQDRDIINDNIDNHFAPAISTYGTPMEIVRSPVPNRDNGDLATSCGQINSDARGYVNGLFVNRSFIMPIYSNNNSGDAEQDSIAIEYYREIMPGYNIVPIDARLLTPMGGAIHCITMQIPADNPIRFWHPPVEGLQAAQSEYNFKSRITNRSGIEDAELRWRVNGQAWKSVSLTDSMGYYVGSILNPGFTVMDTIEYYLHAKSNNGKEMTKPIVAPEGHYRFWFETGKIFLPAIEYSLDEDKPLEISVYPNPTSTNINIYMKYNGFKPLELSVTNVLGETVYQSGVSFSGENVKTIPVEDYSPGVYFIKVSDGDSHRISRFIKQ
ncbi:MAG: T9SS C-terminal target domain-containing protein [Chitinophagaceae bacterium]|nr:MAG: T9SS C-terminal target domain-containing protein [Chitinophagaceae bacterium]